MGVESLSLLRPLMNKIVPFVLIQTKDKDDISRVLLEKMSEIGKQLQKLPDYEENIKNLLIPILNFYLNLNQLDVITILSKAKEQAGK